jgi:hypothetical protein
MFSYKSPKLPGGEIGCGLEAIRDGFIEEDIPFVVCIMFADTNIQGKIHAKYIWIMKNGETIYIDCK